MSEKALRYLQEHREDMLNRLYRFLSIPSVSTDSKHKQDIGKAADFLITYLEELSFTNIEKVETEGHPLVYGEYMEAGEDAPTVLLYGHYDVQPVDPIELWDSDPFKPELRDGRIYARGSSDDKGQVFMHLAVFEAYLKTEGKLPVNVKVCIEGEEEIGSENLYDLLQKNKEKFKADFAVISDSGMAEKNQPTILYGLKGFTGIEIKVTGPDHDLHSGMYGGAVRNPIMALSHILSSLKDKDEVITVEGFYDNVEDISDEERKLMDQAPGEDFIHATGIPEVASEKGYTAKEHTMGRPTLEVNGIYGGYQGEGTKTIIPSTATAKITCRLVPGQDPVDIQDKLVNHVNNSTPSGVTVEVKKEKLSAKAYKVEPTHPLIQKAAKSYTKAFNKDTVFLRMGGSIPVVEWFESIYQFPIVLLGFGTPEDRLHSPNESFPLDSFDKGMETLVYYWSEL
ncbi:dipeptidase [Oceanobacillus iheyensis]|uniref:dipeptidase n=1 Tax=Oceanobacillus iheyensis TaxID=182710 RepID=UPI00363DB7DD